MAQPNNGLAGFTLEPQKYDREFTVEQAIYPADLMGDNSPYGNNMVVFYISIQNDSKLEREQGQGIYHTNPDALKRAGTRSNLEDMKISDGVANTFIKAETAVGGAAVGAAVGATINGVLNAARITGTQPWKVATPIGAIAGAAAPITSGLARHQTRTIKQAIGLYMPNNLSTTYSMGWDTQNTLLGTGIAEGMQGAYDASMGAIANIASSSITSKVLSSGAASAASRLSATTGNPKKEQIFQGVDFRNFTFEYKFMPRSAAEAAKVQNIIRLFKLHQHPEFSPTDGSYLYLYPSEFDIRYYHRDSPTSEWTENLNIHRHTSCVLSTMTVNYGEAGVYSSFVDGHPTQISMTLQFKELALLTKENIQHGF